MKRFDTTYLLRMQHILKLQCESAAAKTQVRLSEWVREALEDKLKRSSSQRRAS